MNLSALASVIARASDGLVGRAYWSLISTLLVALGRSPAGLLDAFYNGCPPVFEERERARRSLVWTAQFVEVLMCHASSVMHAPTASARVDRATQAIRRLSRVLGPQVHGEPEAEMFTRRVVEAALGFSHADILEAFDYARTHPEERDATTAIAWLFHAAHERKLTINAALRIVRAVTEAANEPAPPAHQPQERSL